MLTKLNRKSLLTISTYGSDVMINEEIWIYHTINYALYAVSCLNVPPPPKHPQPSMFSSKKYMLPYFAHTVVGLFYIYIPK